MPLTAPNAQQEGNFNAFWLRFLNKYLFDKNAALRTVHCLSTTRVNFNSGAGQLLYTVPAEAYAMLTGVFIRPGGTTVITSALVEFDWAPGAGASASFDFSSASPSVDGSTNFVELPMGSAAGTSWAMPQQIGLPNAQLFATPIVQEGVDVFALVDVFGFLAPVTDLT